MMAARLLADAGLDVTTLLLGAPEKLAGDAALAWSELTSPMHGRVHVAGNAQELKQHSTRGGGSDRGRGAGHGLHAAAQGPGAGSA